MTTQASLNECRVVVVTGGGRGIGRAEALAFAMQGAHVVVSDVLDPDGHTSADNVVREIEAIGGRAVASTADITTDQGGEELVALAVSVFGGLDTLVNNAGILRDRMLVNMSFQEWQDVISVHLTGTFTTSRHAARYWREESRLGRPRVARVINTTSAAGLYGNVGQANYGTAKAAIAALTVLTSLELSRYGVMVNAVAPIALTRMTEGLRERTEAEKAAMAPENVAAVVSWLGSPRSEGITGRVFNIKGGQLSVAEGWVAGPAADNGGPWQAGQLDVVVPALVAKARGRADLDGRVPAAGAIS